jgi:hypothetical protein
VSSHSSPTSFTQWIERSNKWDPYSTQAEFDSLWGQCFSHSVCARSRSGSEFDFIRSQQCRFDLLFLFSFSCPSRYPIFCILLIFWIDAILRCVWVIICRIRMAFLLPGGYPLFHYSNSIVLL